jgi:hypothetical protein
MTDTRPQGPCAALYKRGMTDTSTRVARACLPVHGKRSEGELQPIHFQPSRTVSGPSFRGAVLFAVTDDNFSEPQKAMKAVRARFPRAISVEPTLRMNVMNCMQQDCTEDTRPWNGKGRKPSYCPEHSQPRYRASRSRALGNVKPECCKANGRGKCTSHRAPRKPSVGPLDPSVINARYWDATSPEADPLSQDHNPLRREFDAGASVISHTMLSMPPRLDQTTETYPVIGQPDLTHTWQVASDGKRPELVWRCTQWPFLDITPTPHRALHLSAV